MSDANMKDSSGKRNLRSGVILTKGKHIIDPSTNWCVKCGLSTQAIVVAAGAECAERPLTSKR